VSARSKAWVRGRSLAGIVGSNPAGGMDVCCECCVLSGRGLCYGLITRPEESYRCISDCDYESSTLRRPWPPGGGGCCAMVKKNFKWLSYSIMSVLFTSSEHDISRPQTIELSLLHFNIVFRLGLDAFVLGFKTRILYTQVFFWHASPFSFFI
jgi:hypothetical protein